MGEDRVVVVGAGMGGLVAALELVRLGARVTLLEAADAPGGKLAPACVGGRSFDAGPTVFTMRWVFDELFESWGTSLDAQLVLRRMDILARHGWRNGSTLDLHADLARSAEAIAQFAGPREAQGFLSFAQRARRIYRALEAPFLRDTRPSMLSLMTRAARRDWRHALQMLQISPFQTMWGALEHHFRDARLQQLFGRYATYCGASPFLAPATLMLVAHVEAEGVWTLDGGMAALGQALSALAVQRGVTLRCGTAVSQVLTAQGRACGVRLADGEVIDADAVVFNGDAAALAQGLLGPEARTAVAPPQARSLSALTWLVVGKTDGFELQHHNVLFSADSRAEFDTLHRARPGVPADPTVYVCAQDRRSPHSVPTGPERLLCLINAPAHGLDHPLRPEEIDPCQHILLQRLAHQGLRLTPQALQVSTPTHFARRFPGTQGALYGEPPHGWRASFRRPDARSRLPGLYLAGGSIHPGAGVPMAALSGRLAAACWHQDRASRRRAA
jgi:1-hydroxycarotenoid 3,4-desaturase